MISVLALQELQLPDGPTAEAMMISTWSNCCNGSTNSGSNCCNET